MNNPFSPVFLTSLLLLALAHSLELADYHLLLPFVFIAFLLAAVEYGFRKFKLCYVFITLSIALLITAQFVKEKALYYQEKEFDVPQNQYIFIQGKLKSFPEIQTDHSVLFLETTSLEFHRQKFHRRLNLRIKVNGDLRHFYRGETVALQAEISDTTFNINFYPHPLENYLLARKTHFNGYCKSARMIWKVKETSWPWRLIGTWRNKIKAAIEKNSPDDRGVFLQAILIGDRGKLTNDREEQFLEAGVYHLIAISGSHIVVIALLIHGLLKLLKVAYRPRYLVISIVLLFFLALSGFAISAERAVLMVILIYIARVLFQEIDIFNILSFSGLVLLAGNPAEFLDAGFILTFTLTAAIAAGRLLFIPWMDKWHLMGWGRRPLFINNLEKQAKKTTSYLKPDVFNNSDAKSLMGWGRRPLNGLKKLVKKTIFSSVSQELREKIFKLCREMTKYREKIIRMIKEILSANFSASLIALPLSLYFFKYYSLGGFLATILLILPMLAITALGLVLIPLAPVSAFLSGVLVTITDIVLRLFFSIIDFFSETIDLSIYGPSPPVVLVVLMITLFFLLPHCRLRPLKITLAALFLLMSVFISVRFFSYSPGHLEVFYLDVGQGDSQVVVFPGGEALLIDGGGTNFSDFQVGKQIVLPFILQKRINIKWIAVSHFHPDHVYGIAEILRILKPEELWISAEPIEEPGYQKLLRAVPTSTRIKKLTAPFRKKVGDCTIEFLFPGELIKEYRAHNNHSQVIKISDAQHSFLFPGDIEAGVETLLTEKNCPGLRATVIKVPHHGSSTSSGPGFLKCVEPGYAVFSCSRGNRFGFPHKRVLKTYQEQGIKYLLTARSGGIRFQSLPRGIRIKTSK